MPFLSKYTYATKVTLVDSVNKVKCALNLGALGLECHLFMQLHKQAFPHSVLNAMLVPVIHKP